MTAALAIGLVAVAEGFNALTGHAIDCACGLLLWYGPSHTPLTSQSAFDWYTPSHVIHGVLFYAALWLVLRRVPASARFLIAVAVEAGWEVLENLAPIVNAYRPPLGSSVLGDTVVNSTADILAMIVGYWAAARLPLWASAALIVAIEVAVGYWLRPDLGFGWL